MDRLAVMRAFVRVVDARSFSAAARHLNVSQPAMSKSIAQLERRLGVRLLIRSTQGLTPTEAGQSFLPRARRALEEADEAELAARGAAAGFTGRLRVSLGVTFGSLYVVPRLPVFLAAHPDLSIDLVLDDRPIDLIGEGIDIGVHIGPLRDSSQTACKLATCRRLVLGTPEYFERAGIPKAPADLTEHAAISYPYDCGANDTYCFRHGASKMTLKLPGRLRVSAVEAMRAAVMAGMGLAVTPEWLFLFELARGDVRPVLTDWTLAASDLWLLLPAGRTASAKARAFASFVKSEVLKRYFVPGLRPLPPLVERNAPEPHENRAVYAPLAREWTHGNGVHQPS
jgi:DNA-binding transcriptional LysR family regulator